MEIEKLFGILNTYQGFTLTLWNLYIGVVLGLLGYAIGSKKAQEWAIRLILVVAFCGFAWGNMQFLERNQILINALSKEIATKTKEMEFLTDLSSAVGKWATLQPQSLQTLHLYIDAGVIFLLLFGPTIAKSFRPQVASD